MKQINDVVGFKNLKIVQDSESFKFSLESILLPNFVKMNSEVKNILDLCTGNAPIPLLLSLKADCNIVGIELQKEIFDLAIETIRINGLENKITIINDDAKNINQYFEKEKFDIITCNPPYFKDNEGSLKNISKTKMIARHELTIDLETIIKIASQNVRYGGYFYMVHRTERLAEVISLMKTYGLEPKKIQFIIPKVNKESNLFLVEAKKGGKAGIKVLYPLIVHDKDGNYTSEIQNIINGVI